MHSPLFHRFAGRIAMAVGVGGVAYSIAFLALLYGDQTEAAEFLGNLFLLVGGFLGTAVMIAVYERVRDTDPSFALWGLALGLVGSAGSAVGGGYRLANVIKTPPALNAGLPNGVDPRGLLTFGVTGLALFIFAWLILRGGVFPRNLAYVGFASAVLLVIVYLGRLIILNPKNPILLTAAALAGFVANPVWFIWVGRELSREPSPVPG